MNPPVPRSPGSLRAAESRGPKSARCPRCGRAFDCGQEARTADCWCRAMPPLPADKLKAGSRCLCPECLAEEIARAQNDPAAAAAADD
ncbi:cysteine-rich CWC family protein [Paraburkholderia sp. SOS3]|jgi:hypothetical protein|uniref:cysteine-rich CWC family protein n=1 Tax=Paraburkholderia sp. SOS3 TaxID=1926494 RepID=UPI000947737B|nr:cysteine-rich CWC family protein [Paraburkholderia sp. SOS3]APR34269.1 hypothetical protein BTO02_01320 [Paraburkholderia sp. SOS3]